MRPWKMARQSIALLVVSFALPLAFGQSFQMYLDTNVIAHSQGAEAYATAFFVPYGYVEELQMALTRDGDEVGYDWAGGGYASCTVWIGDFGFYPPYTLYEARSEAWGNVPDYGWYWDSRVAFGSTPGPQVTLSVEQGKRQGTSGFVLRSWTPGLNTTGLSANGSPPGGSYQWTIGPKLQFDGSDTSESTSVQGTSESESPGDTWVQVSYNAYGYTTAASIRFSVLAPHRLVAPHTGGPGATALITDGITVYGYFTTIPYNVKDQFYPSETIELQGIPVIELLTTLQASHPIEFDPPDDHPKTTYSGQTGQIWDVLSVYAETWPPIGPPFSASRSQTMHLDGYILAPVQIQTYNRSNAKTYYLVLSW